MPVFSIEDRITGWVDDELETASRISGEDFGRHVAMAAMVKPGGGDQIIWIILVTLRSPYLGQEPIGCNAKLLGNPPGEPVVRQGVQACVSALRLEYEKRQAAGLAAGSGQQMGLPAGLREMKLN